MVLHTVNSSPHNSQCLADCLRLIKAPAALLLIEDGVYGATTAAAKVSLDTLPDEIQCFALRVDVDARGLRSLVDDRFTLIDDQQFVELTVSCERIQSWY